MANDIPQLQNGDQALRLLATQRRLYRWAKTISAIQIVLVIVPPTLLLVIDHLSPTLSVWPALAGILIAVLDAAAIDPIKDRLREKAAGVQELFD